MAIRPPTEYYECENCKQEFSVDDAVKTLEYGDPDEWVHECPQCGSYSLKEFSKAWCEQCDIVQVKDDGEICPECQTVNAEMRVDR
jgi:Zn finger protein HypA/HybF involved in hydrogenase expression